MPRSRNVIPYLVDFATPLVFIWAAVNAVFQQWEKALGFLLIGVMLVPLWALIRWWGGRGWRVFP